MNSALRNLIARVRELEDQQAATAAARREPSSWIQRRASNVKLFKLLEDMVGNGPAYARPVDRSGTYIGDPQLVYGHSNLLDGAKVGYMGPYGLIQNEWVALAFGCIEECPTTGGIDVGTPPEGTVDAPYSHTVTGTNLNANMMAANLPPGLSFNGSTGAITGTPTTANTYYVVITGTADNAVEAGSCTLTRIAAITIGSA